jgi:hypothetical protein
MNSPHFITRFVFSLFVLPALAVVLGADSPLPLPVERGRLVVNEDFSSPDAIAKWRVGAGRWTVADGYLTGVEKAENHHIAGIANELKYHDAIIQFRFQFHGGKTAHLLLRTKFGNLCRLIMTPTNIALQRDRPNLPKDTPLKTVVLAKGKAKFEVDHWYQVTAVLQGVNVGVTIEGQGTFKGSEAQLDVNKTEVELMAGGDSIRYDDLKVWEVRSGPTTRP